MVNRVCGGDLSDRGDNVRPPGDAWPGNNVFRIRNQQYWPGFNGHREMIMGAARPSSSFYVAVFSRPFRPGVRANGECDDS